MTDTVYYVGENRNSMLIGCALTFGILAVGMVGWRLAFRFSRNAISASDYCILLAITLAIAQGCFNIICYISFGYGRHKADLPPDVRNSVTPTILFWCNQVCFKLATGANKLSLCFVYLGLFKKADTTLIRVSRNLNYGLGLFIAAFYFSTFVAAIFQCTPVQKSWLSTLDGTCIDLNAMRYVTAVVNIVTSLCVITLPLPSLFRLAHRTGEITQIIVLILLGLIHTSCTVARLVIMILPNPEAKTDPQWANTPSNSAAMVELYIGIMAASLVVMRPCFLTLKRSVFGMSTQGTRTRTNSNGYALSSIPRTDMKGKITKMSEKQASKSVSTEDILRSRDQF